MHSATVAKIPNIHLIVLVIVSSNDEDGHLSVPITSIFWTNHKESSQNHAKHDHGIQFIVNMFSHSMVMVRYITFFILMKLNINFSDYFPTSHIVLFDHH